MANQLPRGRSILGTLRIVTLVVAGSVCIFGLTYGFERYGSSVPDTVDESAPGDVKVTSCVLKRGTLTGDVYFAELTVTNHATQEAWYYIEVDVVDSSGKVIGLGAAQTKPHVIPAGQLGYATAPLTLNKGSVATNHYSCRAQSVMRSTDTSMAPRP